MITFSKTCKIYKEFDAYIYLKHLKNGTQIALDIILHSINVFLIQRQEITWVWESDLWHGDRLFIYVKVTSGSALKFSNFVFLIS